MPSPRPAVAEDTGRNCPFCRFPLKAGAPVVECDSCSSVHHADCWNDNRGCAVMACASAPASGGVEPHRGDPPEPPRFNPASSPTNVLPPSAPGAPPYQQPPYQQPPSPGRSGGGRGLIWAVIFLALVVAGSAAAVVLTGSVGGDSGNDSSRASDVGPGPGSGGSAPPGGDEPEGGSPGDGPTGGESDGGGEEVAPPPGGDTETEAEARDEIQTVLEGYYGDIEAGDYSGAWSVLSSSYKTWKQAPGNGGYDGWLTQSQRQHDRLDPDGLHVEIRSIDPSTDIAELYVSGMSFYTEGGVTCTYEGVTWARKFDDVWYYDQGYRQREDRTAEWRPQRDRTLGYPCENT